MKVAVVIPAYNEHKTIKQVIRSINTKYSVIVVDDCSSDSTGDIAALEGVIVVRHSKNLGYDASLQSGIKKAVEYGMDIAITIDADGQHDASDLDKFACVMTDDSVHLVLGVRHSSTRISEYCFNLYGWIRFGVKDLLCGMKAYRIKSFQVFGTFGDNRSIGTKMALLALLKGFPFRMVDVAIAPREDNSRIGNPLSANVRIFRAFFFALLDDLKFLFNKYLIEKNIH
ncbi:MAG: glycosyltransferase family 2 protein [Betaproteobacteria bacterium]